MLLAFSTMAVGGVVGSGQFTLGALRSLVAKPTAQVTFAMKSCRRSKLHWCIIIMLVGYSNQNSNRLLMATLPIHSVSICESGTDLDSHLHS